MSPARRAEAGPGPDCRAEDGGLRLEVHGQLYISGVISPLIWVIIIGSLLITPLITTHEPPSGVWVVANLGTSRAAQRDGGSTP